MEAGERDKIADERLHLYFYFMDLELGVVHVRVQTWFRLQIRQRCALILFAGDEELTAKNLGAARGA